jgi:hypothetical protein
MSLGPRHTLSRRTQQETSLLTIPSKLRNVTIGADPQGTPFPSILLLVMFRGAMRSIVVPSFIMPLSNNSFVSRVEAG